MLLGARTCLTVCLGILAAGCTREPKSMPEDAGSPHVAVASAPLPVAPHRIARPSEANAELGILTDAAKAAAVKLLTPAQIGAMLRAKDCGDPATCNAVREFVADSEHFTIGVEAAADWGLPPRRILDTLAPGLTPADRDEVYKRAAVIVIKAHGAPGTAHLPARAALAVTAAIAESVHGFAYDEVLHRVETATQFGAHAITSPLDAPVFRPDRVMIELYQQDDGTARLLTLGLRRFGAPDLEIDGAQMSVGRALGAVVNAVAAQLTAGATEAPLLVKVEDRAEPVDFETTLPHEGDPDNALLRIVPTGGATVEGYAALAKQLLGSSVDQLVEQPSDARLALATERAAHAFPAALAKWRKSPASVTLLARLPFAIPETDGGQEWMWIDVKAADATEVTGILTNDPAYAALKAGARVKGKRSEIADWLLKWPDGGTEGGETIRILERRK